MKLSKLYPSSANIKEEEEMWCELNKLLDIMSTRIQTLTIGMYLVWAAILSLYYFK